MPADAADTADKRRCRRHDGSARDAGHGRARRGIAPGEGIVRQERRLFLHGAGLVGRATLHAVAVLVEAHVLRVAGVAVAEQRPLQPVGVAAGQQRQAAADEHRRDGDDRDRALERAVKRHVPDVCAQRQQTAVGKEQALDREDHNHGQKSRPRPEYGREQQAAAQMAGRAGAGDGVVDHLPREHERRHDGHGRQLFGR